MTSNGKCGTNAPLVIGFVSRKNGAGKSTIAACARKFLSEQGFALVYKPFADDLKKICMDLGWDCKKDVKGRRLLERIGNGAREYDRDVWVKKWKQCICDVKVGKGLGVVVIADDVRFENEARMIESMGGVLVEILGDRGTPDNCRQEPGAAKLSNRKGLIQYANVHDCDSKSFSFISDVILPVLIDKLQFGVPK